MEDKEISRYEKWDLKIKWIQIIILLLTGTIIVLLVNHFQNENARFIAKNQQELFAMQVFTDKLTGDRISRMKTILIIKQLSDTILAKKLIEISEQATLELLRYDIWNDDPRVREDAIQEYAKLYCEYPLEVLDALMPRRYHLQSGKVVISIAKFFYYLAIYDTCTGGKWKGTKSDSAQFAKIKTSEFYKDTINYKNLRKFMDICLANFEERNTTYTYPPKYINLYENNKPDNMMDD